jgi:hypothetical protein
LHKQFWTEIIGNWIKNEKNLPSSGVVLLFSGVRISKNIINFFLAFKES